MSKEQPQKSEANAPDLSDFGNLVPVFANRFYVYRGSEISRIFFGEMMKLEGESSFHSSIVMRTADLIKLMELIARLTKHRVDQLEEGETDG